MVSRAGVFHEAHGLYAFPVGPKTLVVRLRAARGEITRCRVLYRDRYAHGEADDVVEMARIDSDALFDYFEARLTLPLARFRYVFALEDARGGVYWFGEKGFLPGYPTGWHEHFEYPYVGEADLPDTPEWVKDAVFYEIFPDRFHNGDPANDPVGSLPWGERPTYESFFGGDLEGIRQKVAYLADLGVTAIYLTPIFAGPSVHKYDTADYFRIDPGFGDEKTVRRLVDECHAAGIRVVLDGVFNHCGFEFGPFRDVMARGSESGFSDWFKYDSLPLVTEPAPNYETWANGVAFMPKLRTANPATREYLLGVARHWTERLGIDGWRLDVANEVDHAFWREFRRVVRAANPDAFIVGEVMHRALPWLGGDQFDSVMNYPLQRACVEFFGNGSIRAGEFDAELAGLRMAYPEPVTQVLWNLLGSHDTPRILTECGGDARKAALAAVFLLTYQGVPLVYYGDEVGIEGGYDPDCRRTMVWDKERWDRLLSRAYREVIALRKSWSALRRGRYRTLLADSITNVIAFWRGDDAGEVVVLLNNGGRRQRVEIPPALGEPGSRESWRLLWQSPGCAGEPDDMSNDGPAFNVEPLSAVILGRSATVTGRTG